MGLHPFKIYFKYGGGVECLFKSKRRYQDEKANFISILVGALAVSSA